MHAIRRFWSQPSTHYRNFQLVYALLFLNFAIPTLLYVFAPGRAMEGFSQLNVLLGGGALETPVGWSFWRVLGAANVAALAFMCLWVMLNLRERLTVVVPLIFLKGTAAALWLVAYFQSSSVVPSGAPVMLAAGIFDVLTCGAFAVFALVAYADIQDKPEAALVPRPVRSSPLGWAGFEHRWAEAALSAALPGLPGSQEEDGSGLTGDQPGFADADTTGYWEEFARHLPMHFRFGLRLATWALTFWPIFSFRSIRLFHRLSADRQDEILQSIDGSRFFLVRQIVFVLKTVAAMAYFRDPSIQQRYDSAYPGLRCDGVDDKAESR